VRREKQKTPDGHMHDPYDGDGFEFSVRGATGYGKRILVHATKAALLSLEGEPRTRDLLSIFNAHAQQLSMLALVIHNETGLERIVLSPKDVEGTAWQLARHTHSPHEH
jgi:hypothetical protein